MTACEGLASPSGRPASLERVRKRIEDWALDEAWAIGVVERPIASFLDDPRPDVVRWIEAPAGSYYADPFGIPDSKTLLCERVDHVNGLGRLVALTQARDGWRERSLDLGLGVHLSFPFLIRAEGALWCLPEASASGRLALWRLEGDVWRRGAVIEGLRAIDPVLFAHRGLWWLAYTDGSLGESDNLCLRFAPALAGPWRTHPDNPVVTGANHSRNGGTPFVAREGLYRPAQDCAEGYGRAVVVHRIERLDPKGYAERPVARVTPDPQGSYPHGLHTLSAWRQEGRTVTLIDAKRHRIEPMGLWRRVKSRTTKAMAWRAASI